MRLHSKNSLYNLTKGTLSLDEYIWKFKVVCDKLPASGKPLSDVDKVFQVPKGLGNKYKEFQIVVLSKPLYLSFNQFIMSLQNFEQIYLAKGNHQLIIIRPSSNEEEEDICVG